ncbi:putative WRKY transcription factor 51 [Tasmannia lanceolata]|uniref:putative WRKY transcription factor 51 n=1 Tax=Tasmannia lanceolata TaxID=3420 RepID=UPI004062C1B3
MSDSSKSRHYGFIGHQTDIPTFELSDYLNLECVSEEDLISPAVTGFSQIPAAPVETIDDSGGSSNMTSESEGRGIQMDHGVRIAFRTKSELEVLDDGFKWRKYGKKQVKNSPNPRNYYRCSNGDCPVKKRVERDREDSSYVITSYEGVHNHESPCVIYCTPQHNSGLPSSEPIPLMVPHSWSLKPPRPSP